LQYTPPPRTDSLSVMTQFSIVGVLNQHAMPPPPQ